MSFTHEYEHKIQQFLQGRTQEWVILFLSLRAFTTNIYRNTLTKTWNSMFENHSKAAVASADAI